MSFDEQWFVYRDVEDFPRKQFERLATPKKGDRVIRDQVFPGAFGKKDMHIKLHTVAVGTILIRLITYTEAPISSEVAADLAQQALAAGANT